MRILAPLAMLALIAATPQRVHVSGAIPGACYNFHDKDRRNTLESVYFLRHLLPYDSRDTIHIQIFSNSGCNKSNLLFDASLMPQQIVSLDMSLMSGHAYIASYKIFGRIKQGDELVITL
jgi:hypothetical protein